LKSLILIPISTSWL